jgi:hypothetical protein
VTDPESYQFGKLTIDDEQNLSRFKQGYVLLDVQSIPVVSAAGTVDDFPTPNGVAVFTQTCDIVNWSPSRRTVQVAPIAILPEPKATEARRGKRPQYVHLPELGDSYFADLEVVATLDKAYVAGMSGGHGVADGIPARRFGQATGRKYNRYPFPDEVVLRLQPLESLIVSKHDADEKPESWALQRVRQIRVTSDNGWDGPSYDVKLLVVLEPGVLPMFADDELPDRPQDLEVWLYDNQYRLKRQAGEIAGKLRDETDPVRQYWLWAALVDAWAEKCRPKGKHRSEPTRLDAVITVTAELWSADEFPMTMMDSSEPLDIDHLSAPRIY